MPRPMRARLLTAGTVAAVALFTMAAGASAHDRTRGHAHHHAHHHQPGGNQFTASVFASGAKIDHPIAGGSEPISNPDDITHLGDHIFVGFQNGVGPQGQASASGNTDSTIVEFSLSGHELAQWDVTGKCDGVTADPDTGQLIATVNEDANSSVYVIDPQPGSTPVQYQYSVPLPSYGGTDAISIYHGTVLISASAPGTTGGTAPSASAPAIYEVWFDQANDIAYVNGLYGDEAPALVANTNSSSFGSFETLGLTDPDSNEVVPDYAQRFAGDFMLTSQGDQEQLFYSSPWEPLRALSLTASVDDSGWPSDRSDTLYTTDNSNNDIIEVTGPFQRGSEVAAVTPCDSNNAPSTCPGPGYPANYLGAVNPYTGVITPLSVSGPSFAPQGLLLLPGRQDW
jgi:hypothetical protein